MSVDKIANLLKYNIIISPRPKERPIAVNMLRFLLMFI